MLRAFRCELTLRTRFGGFACFVMCSSNSSAARFQAAISEHADTAWRRRDGGKPAGRCFRGAPEPERQLVLDDVTGGRITCETLKLWDVKYVFGNTGAYEAGFVDALVDFPDIHYVLGLQEGSVMAMADGYARITGQTSFVNIHSITGTANALGLIVNAWADSSPVVVSVGMSERSGENLGVFTETNKLEAIPSCTRNCRSVRAASRTLVNRCVAHLGWHLSCHPGRCFWAYRPMYGRARRSRRRSFLQ